VHKQGRCTWKKEACTVQSFAATEIPGCTASRIEVICTHKLKWAFWYSFGGKEKGSSSCLLTHFLKANSKTCKCLSSFLEGKEKEN